MLDNCLAMPRHLHQIERLDNFPGDLGGKANKNYYYLANLRLCRIKWGEETHNSASVPLSSVLELTYTYNPSTPPWGISNKGELQLIITNQKAKCIAHVYSVFLNVIQ